MVDKLCFFELIQLLIINDRISIPHLHIPVKLGVSDHGLKMDVLKTACMYH